MDFVPEVGRSFFMLHNLLLPHEVAEIIGVCTKTVSRYTQDGRIKAVWISPKIVRYQTEEVERFIRDCRRWANQSCETSNDEKEEVRHELV